MRSLGSLVIGYLIGGLNPARIIGKLKRTDLRAEGTGNLGATNVTLSIGKGYGIFVMLFDILKAFFSAKLAALLFPQLALAGPLAACGAVVGHVYPVYLKFRGGKGLASFGGLILAVDPILFPVLLLIGFVAVTLTGHAVALTFSAAIAAPILAGWYTRSMAIFCIVLAASCLLLWKHLENIGKIRRGDEKRIRDYLHDRRAEAEEAHRP